MANEVTVLELQGLRGDAAVRPMPPLKKQVLSIGGAVSTAFLGGTAMVSIYTTTACKIEFSKLDGTAPNGAGAGSGVFPIPATTWVDFSVRAGDQVIAVA